MTPKIRWLRVIKLTLFSLLVLATAFDLSAAWLYVQGLVAPPCNLAPPTLSGTQPIAVELETPGHRLSAWYYPSQNGAAILALGGQGGALGAQLPLVEPLLTLGYGVLQMDSRRCAQPPGLVTLGALESQDAEAGLNFLASQPEVDRNRIGVIGFSMGGVAAIRLAARTPVVAAVVAEGGFFNLGDDIVERGAPSSFTRRIFLYTIAGWFWVRTDVNPWEISPLDDLPLVAPRPVMLIYGENEAESGQAQRQFLSAREPKTLWIVPGGSHGSNHLASPEEYPRRIVEFFDQALFP